MSLTNVRMSEEVWLTCVTHALTTETEEIMGLLLGDIKQTSNGSVTAVIWGASPQMRSDRRKDRVETNPELLAAASAQHKMTAETGVTTRVIGWYHSHPHITVLPSHVDVRTQAMYQLLDPGFIGLIFSCYSEDAQKVGRIQVIAFQSLDGRQRHVKPVNCSSIIEVESQSTSEVSPSTSVSSPNDFYEEDTGDSRDKRATKDCKQSSNLVNLLEREKAKVDSIVPYNMDNQENTIPGIDAMDLSDGMQEALHRSNLEMSGAEYIRKEVPLQVLPSRSLLNLDNPLKSFIDMQYMLFEEEQSAYNHAISHNSSDGRIHPLSFIHHTSTYQASLCKLMEYCLLPALNAVQGHQKENEIRLAMLKDEAKLLAVESKRRETMKSTQRLTTQQGHRRSATFDGRDVLPSSSPKKNSTIRIISQNALTDYVHSTNSLLSSQLMPRSATHQVVGPYDDIILRDINNPTGNSSS